jgi:hypothetical protein
MSDLAYFEYSLVLPEERYLIEVQTRNPSSGEPRTEEEIQEIAKESLALVIGEGHDDVVRGLKPNPISDANWSAGRGVGAWKQKIANGLN